MIVAGVAHNTIGVRSNGREAQRGRPPHHRLLGMWESRSSCEPRAYPEVRVPGVVPKIPVNAFRVAATAVVMWFSCL
jgi:hypothetical protein